MLTGMQTSEEQLVTTAFEPCAGFAAAGDGSPECTACGWLDHEHDAPGADVRPLPHRGHRFVRAPKRLAS
jgi:hypothetical protein